MITEDYVSFETAKLLKEKGFPQEYDRYHSLVYNEKDYEDEYEVQRMVLETRIVKAGTLSSYPVGVPEPKCYCCTLQMAMKWLRGVHKLSVRPRYDEVEDKEEHLYYLWFFDILSMNPYKTLVEPVQGYYTYEEACESAIKYCLENLI